MDMKTIVIAAIVGIILIIGFVAFSGLLPSEKPQGPKAQQNINVSDVKHSVTVDKPQVALFAEASSEPPIEKGSSELTVYNQNLALVKDVRELDLEKGVNLVKFKDIASQIDPTSVFFRDMKYPGSFVVEQSYQYDLVSTQKILEKYLDKEITVQANEGDKVQEYKGLLLSYGNGIVLQTKDGIVTLPSYSKIRFPELPGGLLTKPTLVWKIYSDQAGNRDTETVYLTGGIDWRADYIATVNADDSSIGFAGWTTINNTSGTSYPDTKLKLVAGDVHRVTESPRYAEAYDYAVKAGTAAPQQFGQSALFEYYLYTLGRKTDILNNETKQISLLSSDKVPVAKEFVFDGSSGGYYYSDSSGNKKVEVRLKFKNSEDQGLGLPLPKGKVRVYKKDLDGQLQFIGEDLIDHTKKEDEIELLLGNAFDVTGERTKMSHEEISRGLYREEYKIKLENQKDSVAKVKIKEHASGYQEWRIIKNSHSYNKKSATEFEFEVDVPAKGTTEVTYTIEYRSYY